MKILHQEISPISNYYDWPLLSEYYDFKSATCILTLTLFTLKTERSLTKKSEFSIVNIFRHFFAKKKTENYY